MKKLIVSIILGITIFIGFGCEGTDPLNCYLTVKEQYEEVFSLSRFKFIVRDKNGDIYYIETMNLLNADITKIIPVFKGE